MCMGKGGVGKTTIAAAIAVALAQRGHHVHLTTTDPAAHLTETLHGTLDNLQVSRIDPAEATRTTATTSWPPKAPPSTTRAAPTSPRTCAHHAPRKSLSSRPSPASSTNHRASSSSSTPRPPGTPCCCSTPPAPTTARSPARWANRHFTTPLMRLQNPQQTKVIIVTLAETTPVLEAAGLQTDLERAGIHPWAWVVNNSLAAAHPTSPLLRRRAVAELPEIDKVRHHYVDRVAVVPLLATEPVGIPALEALTEPRAAMTR